MKNLHCDIKFHSFDSCSMAWTNYLNTPFLNWTPDINTSQHDEQNVCFHCFHLTKLLGISLSIKSPAYYEISLSQTNLRSIHHNYPGYHEFCFTNKMEVMQTLGNLQTQTQMKVKEDETLLNFPARYSD